MFTEFHHIPFLGMSNPELFIVKKDKKQIEFEVSSIPTLEFPDGSQVTASNDQPKLHDHHHHHQEEEQHNREEEEKCESTASSENLKTLCLGESEVVDDDDDGFRTPTSSDHKIPVITQCPPAPKKLRLQPSRKTKASPPQLRRRSLQLDLLRDAELMFSPPPLREDLGRKIKRARRDYNTE